LFGLDCPARTCRFSFLRGPRFERSAVLSTQPAEAIARAAQSFGQKDDITVLTLKFAPA